FYEYKKTADNQFVFLIDIDDFKEVNDSYGHSAGDRVLKTIVEIIKNEIRETDSLFRWGGEEFLLVCKYMDVADIASFAQRIIDSVKNTPITIRHPRKKKQKLLEYKKENGSDELGVSLENTVLFNETTTSLFLTISAGISCFSPKDTSYLECFKRTDAALYESKNTGKNKYTILY
ncbi:MAG TPA: GGDEF domain-containing protein, partial [Treponemataceae bacterium]|nr:GGDEF domain-containing protein [Treponemataceae bacterium]